MTRDEEAGMKWYGTPYHTNLYRHNPEQNEKELCELISDSEDIFLF